MKRVLLLAVCLGSLFLWTASANGADQTIKLTADFKFSPDAVTVSVGDSVKFVWEAGLHNVKFEDGEGSGDPTSTSGNTWSRKFTSAGSFPFVCEVHAPAMKGTVTVQAAAGEDPSPTPKPAKTPAVTPGILVQDIQARTADDADPPEAAADRTFPLTGPESSFLPQLGGALIAAGGGWFFVGRRRNRRRR